MIKVKSEREIILMKKAGEILSNMFKEIKPKIVSGVSTSELNDWIDNYITSHEAIAAEKGYYDYPASACISVNDTLIHGIPSNKIILKDGDIVSIDVVVSYHGYMADACRTFGVGTLSTRSQRLIDVTKEAFYNSLKYVKVGGHIGDISNSIQNYVESHGYNVVRDFTGHGIGSAMHEDPVIPNYGKANTGEEIIPNMAICIEPMVLEGKKDVRVLGDGWTVKSKDGKLTAHYENTVIVKDDGYEIITTYKGEN